MPLTRCCASHSLQNVPSSQPSRRVAEAGSKVKATRTAVGKLLGARTSQDRGASGRRKGGTGHEVRLGCGPRTTGLPEVQRSTFVGPAGAGSVRRDGGRAPERPQAPVRRWPEPGRRAGNQVEREGCLGHLIWGRPECSAAAPITGPGRLPSGVAHSGLFLFFLQSFAYQPRRSGALSLGGRRRPVERDARVCTDPSKTVASLIPARPLGLFPVGRLLGIWEGHVGSRRGSARRRAR